jgi:hypothetical protein
MTRLLAPLRGWESRRALRTERRRADEQLLATRLPSPRLAWRTAELVGEDHRVDVARRLTDIVHGSDERFLPGASPVDRGAVRACRAELLELASRIFDVSRPVAPRGVLLVEQFLAGGALYGNGRTARLRLDVEAAREALEPFS